jgi:hypothetical protein
MAKRSHIINIMERLLAGEKLTSIDQLASNSNQYFGTIKNNAIELVEVWRPNLSNKGKHKERSLHQTIENIERAKAYLERLKK